MISVALHNLGCKVNGYEMDVMQQMLQEKGYKIVPFDEHADIYIINTCTVTNVADKKSRQMLHRARKKNPEAVVVAVGCYVQTGKEEVLKDESIDLVIGNNRKKDLIPILEEFLSKQQERSKTLEGKTVIDIGHTKEYESMMLRRTAEHTRAFIKIQDGCNQFCTYCIIPYARGRVRSRKEEEILKEVINLAQHGYREVVLTGIHISSYGLDFNGINNISGGEGFPHERLLTLIKKIHEIEGVERIRLGSLEPRIVTENFAKELSVLPKFCPHFHISLQSGCNTVLKRMNRRYTVEEYYEKVCILREFFKDPAITTDIIVGFPGETEEEFEITRNFLEKVCFYEMHIFKYSKRKGTIAAAMKNQIREDIKAERSDILIRLEQEMSHEFRKKHLHTEMAVLFEEQKEIGGRQYQIGHTMEYIKVAALSGKNLSGRILKGSCSGFLQPDILLFEGE
ncbi:MAG: tRNA (N(6)-L-threonylcarbamoyladenosine(37)-C(2))-methylthiotransferase MtaB [Lachnospiraceae bacterium]|nr:tRNA (N(6)-L-threonylcarbamoyladenosine(37)-C(2))-methylthiotransferase MtaB [Lachnospiraceae bacterium]